MIPPPLLWAQRKTIIYITVDVEDFRPTTVAVDGKELTICGSSAATNAQYDVKLELFAEVETVSVFCFLQRDISRSCAQDIKKHQSNQGHLDLVLTKKSADGKETEWWPRLTANKTKLHFLKVSNTCNGSLT